MLDARKSEIYTAVYDCKGFPSAIVEDCVVSTGGLSRDNNGNNNFCRVGERIRYREMIESALGAKAIFAPLSCNQPRASAGAVLSHHAFEKGDTIPLDFLNPSIYGHQRPKYRKIKR